MLLLFKLAKGMKIAYLINSCQFGHGQSQPQSGVLLGTRWFYRFKKRERERERKERLPATYRRWSHKPMRCEAGLICPLRKQSLTAQEPGRTEFSSSKRRQAGKTKQCDASQAFTPLLRTRTPVSHIQICKRATPT